MPAVECDACRRRYQVDANLVGKPVRCRSCGKAFIAKPYGMDPTRTSMATPSRPEYSMAAEEPLVVLDDEDLDDMFEAAEAAPRPKAAPVQPRFHYNNPLDIHAPEPQPMMASPYMPRRSSGSRWWVWVVVGVAGVAMFALLIWAISAAISPSSPSPAAPKSSGTAKSNQPDTPRVPSGPTYILPPAPPGVGEFAVQSLPTLSEQLDDIVLDVLRHPAAIGPYMFRPPAGHTIRGRRDGEQPEVQSAGGDEIDTGTPAGKVPSQRMNVVVVPVAQARFKTPDEMLATPPVRYRQGTVNGMPFVATYDVRSFSRDRFAYVSNYHVFTGKHVVSFEVIAAEPFDRPIHRELAYSVNSLRPLDVVVQALGDIAKGDAADRAAAMKRLATQAPDSARRDKVIAAAEAGLRDPDPALRAAAVDTAAAWIANPARRTEALLSMLADEDRKAREQAITHLGSAGDDPNVIKAMAGVFESSPGAVSRAMKSIGPASEKTVIELLRKHADSSALAGNLFDVLDSVATSASVEDVRALARSEKRPVAERARKVLRKLDKDFDVVAEAMLDLDQPAGPHVKEAVELLVGTKPDAARREKVSEALRRVAFEGTDEQVADRAADVLAVWGTSELVPKLVEILGKADAVAGARRRAIVVLTGVKDARGAAAVASLIGQENALVVESLKQMGPVAEDEVIKLLRDRQPAVRRDACVILGVIGSPKAIPQISALINDPKNPEIPQAAKAALDAIRARNPK